MSERKPFLDMRVTRRQMLAASAAGFFVHPQAPGRTARWEPPTAASGYLPGEVYEAVVPDTLDLAERARLGISGLTGMVDPSAAGEMFVWVFYNTNPPTMMHSFDGPVLQPKCVEAEVMLRSMCGSRQNEELGRMSVDWLLKSLDVKNGLLYGLNRPERPWHIYDGEFRERVKSPGTESLGKHLPGADQDYARVYAQFRVLRALIALRQARSDPSLDEYGRRLISGISKMAIHKTDPQTGERYAYFPAEGGINQEMYLGSAVSRSGWSSDREPRDEKDGAEEGSVFMGWGAAPGPLSVWYEMTGHQEALSLAEEFARFLTRRTMWGVPNDPFDSAQKPQAGQALWEASEGRLERSAQLAHWKGHWEGHMEALRGLLEYALVKDDTALKNFVRSGYEWARNYGIPQLGWADHQACYTPRLMAVAIKLTRAGLGDYWEDIDRYIRNNGTEQQLLDPKLLAEVVRGLPEPIVRDRFDSTDRVLEKSIGLFSGHANETECLKPPARFTITCCIPHALMGLYYAWDAALDFEEGTACINLLLNRASPWLDIDSYLPYEGKVVIRNKKANRVFARIPAWTDRRKVVVRLRGIETRCPMFGNYTQVDGLKPGDVVVVEFPMVESTERLGEFTMRFRGNTLVDISPRSRTGGYPMYLRDGMREGKAPMKKVARYVAPARIQW